MAISTSEKEKEILEFIESQIKKEKWTLLTEDGIKNKFSNNEFDSDDIKKILSDLEENNRIIEKDIGFSIYSTKVLSKQVDDKLKGHIIPYKSWSYIISFIIWAILLTNDRILNIFIVTNTGDNSVNLYGVFVLGFLISLFAIQFINQFIVTKILSFVKDKSPELRKYLWTTYSFIITGAVGWILYSVFEISKNTATSIFAIGGIALLGIIHSIMKSEKVRLKH